MGGSKTKSPAQRVEAFLARLGPHRTRTCAAPRALDDTGRRALKGLVAPSTIEAAARRPRLTT